MYFYHIILQLPEEKKTQTDRHRTLSLQDSNR
jgi:hypothetical protein